jgi:hypothetical protein
MNQQPCLRDTQDRAENVATLPIFWLSSRFTKTNPLPQISDHLPACIHADICGTHTTFTICSSLSFMVLRSVFTAVKALLAATSWLLRSLTRSSAASDMRASCHAIIRVCVLLLQFHVHVHVSGPTRACVWAYTCMCLGLVLHSSVWPRRDPLLHRRIDCR